MSTIQQLLLIPPAVFWVMIGIFWLRGYTGGMMGLSLAYIGLSSVIAVVGAIFNPAPWSWPTVGFIFFCYLCLLGSVILYFDNPDDNNTTYD